ncbi:MAG TPA: TIGR03619 family F420-dependent LLM class oxidoreductase [Alphaproteobacteria bacterium]|nr:TIGR03619 family F420-dependent LLM class oxidoreductase [Alphaproteobacteria bacterium]
MKYGFTLPGRGPLATPDSLAAIAKRGEQLGYHLLLFGDHIVVPRRISSPYPYTESGEFPGSASGQAMEQLTVLAFLAGQTQTIRLVTSVIIVPHRNPLVAAKALATLDVLSKGRLVVGVGVGWMQEEFETLGLPPFKERGAVTDEYIRAFKELWTSDDPSFEGKYCRFSNISFLPKPVQKPHPPIWVGGESRRALRRTAELGNGWYPIGSNPRYPLGEPEQLAAALQQLAAYAEAAGRAPHEIEVIYRTADYQLNPDGRAATSPMGARRPFVGNADDIAADIRRYEAMGVGYLIVDFGRLSRDLSEMLQHMETLATQVWPRV